MVEHWTFNPLDLGSSPNSLNEIGVFFSILCDMPRTCNGIFAFKKMITNLIYFLIVNTILFSIGALGLVLNRKNILIIIMSIELMLLSVNLNFIIFSIYLDDLLGQLFVIFILTIAATESAIGLAILSSYYRVKNTIVIDKIKQIKG